MNRRACIMWDNGAVFTVDSELSKKMLVIYDEAQLKFEPVKIGSETTVETTVEVTYPGHYVELNVSNMISYFTRSEARELSRALLSAVDYLEEKN